MDSLALITSQNALTTRRLILSCRCASSACSCFTVANSASTYSRTARSVSSVHIGPLINPSDMFTHRGEFVNPTLFIQFVRKLLSVFVADDRRVGLCAKMGKRKRAQVLDLYSRLCRRTTDCALLQQQLKSCCSLRDQPLRNPPLPSAKSKTKCGERQLPQDAQDAHACIPVPLLSLALTRD